MKEVSVEDPAAIWAGVVLVALAFVAVVYVAVTILGGA